MAFQSTIRVIILMVFMWSLLPFFCICKLLKTVYTYVSPGETVKGKVVLITGASSGIGQQLCYEYAKREASLVIVARRENLIKKVAEEARRLGSPDVIPICADVCRVEDCKRIVEEAVDHFGRLDHVVNNAGISCYSPLEDVTDISKLTTLMDVNFWGSIYPTYFAIPHLKKSKGTIFVNASATAYLHAAGLSLYGASKAALVNFYDTVRVELGPEIAITIATLGFVDSEMTRGKHLNTKGTPEFNPELSNAFINKMPVMSSEDCAKSIVEAVCRKQRYVTKPTWFRLLFLLEILCPELTEWVNRNSYRELKSKTREAKPISGSLSPSQYKSY